MTNDNETIIKQLKGYFSFEEILKVIEKAKSKEEKKVSRINKVGEKGAVNKVKIYK